MMRVLLIRHAEAEPKNIGRPDLERHLTKNGQQQAETVGRALAALYKSFDCVVTSKAARAIETADAICRRLGSKMRIETSSLNPGCGPDGWKATLSELPSGVESVALVGHEPDFSAMLGRAIGAPKGRFDFRKLGCAMVEWGEDNHTELVAFLPPEVLLMIGQVSA